MQLNIWARNTLIEAYEKVYNDMSTTVEDAKKIKKIITLLKKGNQPILTEVAEQ